MASNVFINDKELKEISKKLSKFPKQIPGATASALNRTLTHTATQTKREVCKVYYIKQRDVANTLKKKKASKSNLNAYVQSRGRTIALSKFPHTPKKYRKRAKEVKVKIKKDEPAQVIETSPKAFVQTMNGVTHIWKRKGKERAPVQLLRTLSIPQMVGNKKVLKKIQESSRDMLRKRIEHEVSRRLDNL